MHNNFVCLKIKREQFFDQSPIPQKNTVLLYAKFVENKLVLMTKDQFGNHQILAEQCNCISSFSSYSTSSYFDSSYSASSYSSFSSKISQSS